jgi:hypothetical protein
MMNGVRSVRNQYRGINAHLHSYWQAEGGWDEFHTSHIVYLSNALRSQLLPMGYTAGIEQSLQIRRADVMVSKPKSDVTIYDTDPTHISRGSTVSSIAAPVVTTIPEIVDDLEETPVYRALALYQVESGQANRGEPVAWIEVLSPSNKPGGQDDDYYAQKRLRLLHSGIVFVEIDYLHESPPTFSKIPPYRMKGLSSSVTHPYRIVVLDPRPSFYDGTAYQHPFDIDDPLPVVDIPLNGDDVLRFDFGLPYQRTVQEQFFTLEHVNYRQLPLHFERYSEADQARIVCRMLAVLKAVREGINLETAAPLPVELLPLDEAMKQFQVWSAS